MPSRPDDAATARSLPGGITALVRDLVDADAGARGGGWDAALRPGLVVGGRFELVREKGRGGFGVVYEARDRELGRTVAFKAVRVGAGAAAEERLLSEAEVAARLSHPNIVTLFDVGRTEHGPYLVLELLRGEPLARRLERGPLPVMEALRIASEVAKGLAHAHAQGVVHRDLTPGNVFVCEDGQVKLLDLGMAQAFGRRKVDGGTPSFMAPEQERGAPEDERTDVFALGALLYRMLSGERPPAGRPLPALHVPGLPALGPLVTRMVDPEPVRRPRDAGEVALDLVALFHEAERAPPAASVVVRRWRPRVASLLVAVGVGVAVGVAFTVGTHRAPRAPEGAAAPSIAVLPFANLGGDRDQDFFSDGLTEEIVNALARVDGLRVAGRTSSFSFKGRDVKLADVGRELGVGAVLEGSVRRAGQRVRVAAQVVNVADGFQLWSQEFDRELKDVFAVQDEISRAVVQALSVRLVSERHPAGASRTDSPDAHLEVLIARKLLDRAAGPAARQAVESAERAVALDPGYAAAWAQLADAAFFAGDVDDDPVRRADLQRRSREAAERAVRLAPDATEALLFRAQVRRCAPSWDWAGAEADVARAMTLAPSDPRPLLEHAGVIAAQGRVSEAAREVRRVLQIDPLARRPWASLGKFLTFAGDQAEARRALQRSIEIAPDTEASYLHLAITYLVDGRAADALAWSQRSPGPVQRLQGRALALHDLGREQEARAALAELAREHAAAWSFQIAETYAWVGEADAAFAALDRAVQNGDGGLEMLKYSPLLRSIRGDRRYAALLRRLHLPEAPAR